jgi:dCTP deaminase
VVTSVLSDGTLRRLIADGRIVIDPWDDAMVQPASVDVRLGDSFRVFHNYRVTAIDLREPPRNLTEEIVAPDGEPFAIHPGEFVLGRTLETVEIPDDLVCRIEGKSSIGRLGLIVHATAGFVDPGFRGTLTLEITNFNSVPIVLRPGLPIAQLSFMGLDRPAEVPYGSPELGSHYHGQVEATESRYGATPAPRPSPATGRSSRVRAMLHGILVLAAEAGESEPSKTPFYIAGALVACWAVVLAAIGLSRPSFPGTVAAERGVMLISVVLVAAAMTTAVVTA